MSYTPNPTLDLVLERTIPVSPAKCGPRGPTPR